MNDKELNQIAEEAAERFLQRWPEVSRRELENVFKAVTEKAYAIGWNESWQNQDLLRENERKEAERAAQASGISNPYNYPPDIQKIMIEQQSRAAHASEDTKRLDWLDTGYGKGHANIERISSVLRVVNENIYHQRISIREAIDAARNVGVLRSDTPQQEFIDTDKKGGEK